MNEVETAWLAGLLEGEATFGLYTKSNGRGPYAHLQMGMVDEDVVAKAAALIGVPYRMMRARTPNRQAVYGFRLSGWPAIDVMKQVLPHLGARRSAKVADILAAYVGRAPRRDGATHCRNGHPFGPRDRNGRRRCHVCRRQASAAHGS